MQNALTFQTLDSKLGPHSPFLISCSDGLREELHIVIAAAEAGKPGSNIPEGVDKITNQALYKILLNARPIEINERCLYEICFHDYIIYQVRNESFCSYDPEEVRHGRHLIIFETSKLLSHLSTVTDAGQLDDGSYYPGRWRHYGIYTQNHIIDVIAQNAPDVSACVGESFGNEAEAPV